MLTLAACSDSTGGGHCTIVTNGERWVFRHELAHCNGWTHEQFQPAETPADLVHDYPGRLTIIQCGGRKRHKAQSDAEFVEGCKSARKRCFAMWKERGDDVSAYSNTRGYREFVGCSFQD